MSFLVNLHHCRSLCEAYNESDTTFGLLHTSSDLSVFFDAINGTFHNYSSILVRLNHSYKETTTIVSEKSRTHVQNQMGTTVVDIQQQHRKFLGQPYSICVEMVSQLLNGL